MAWAICRRTKNEPHIPTSYVESPGMQFYWINPDNILEACHHSFYALMSWQHPSLWTLLKSLRSQQALSQSTINDIHRGSTFTGSSKKRQSNERIEKLTSEYTSGITLNKIGLCFKHILYIVCLNRLFYKLSFSR